MLEKPLASAYEDCLRVNRVSEETGIPCFVAYYRRYLPYFLKVKEILERGVIGNVVDVRLRFAEGLHADTIIIRMESCHGACSPMWLVEVIFTFGSSPVKTSCNNCLVLF